VQVILYERLLPYRKTWLPTPRDLTDDAFYALLVQTLVPLSLSWITIWLLQRGAARENLTLSIWPAMWPIWLQLIAKIAIGDFFRYWLHRIAHNWNPIWRLHALHHQPPKMYSTNVFRFHPLEKALQFGCDSLPFIVAGIGPDVLAYYFVFYAISGLFQHSNADIRLGILNYFVSGPEVHRWHHSRKILEANANYAHSFVLWDVLFGTYYRPRDMEVQELGLFDQNFPQGALAQIAAPFQPALWA
jgi:sterol desaturase/sphingolipid hydroxylase (fatty acid hydroxylase superfamily)